MIISTGMTSKDEIAEAIECARQNGAIQIAILHCVSSYPAPAEDYNLKTIPDMMQQFGVPIGISDHTLDNVTAILDYNGLQIDGPVKDVMNINPISNKWRAFGWYVIEINGHDFKEILDSFERVKKLKSKPSIIIAHTTKGKGVSFMENVVDFHGKAPTKEQMVQALKELEENEE